MNPYPANAENRVSS